MPQALGALSALILAASNANPPPHLDVEWTVQQRSQGKVHGAYQLFRLVCWNDFPRGATPGCRLTTVLLNNCFDGEFSPYVGTWTTAEDQFTVSWSQGQAELTVVDRDETTTLLVSFQCRPSQPIPVCDLTGISGGTVARSRLLDKVFVTEYVPLHGDDYSRFTKRKIDCKIELPTVPRPKTRR